MSFELVKEQLKSKAAESSQATVSMDALSESLNKAAATGATSTEGGFLVKITAALEAYASGKKQLESLDQSIASIKETIDNMPEIKDPEIKKRSKIGQFFFKLFHKNKAKAEEHALEDAQKQREEQEAEKVSLNQQISELEDQKPAANAAMVDALTQYSTLLASATQKDKKEMAANESFVRRAIAVLPEDSIKATADAIYAEIDESHIALLRELIKARFGVPVVDSTPESIEGIPDEVMPYIFRNVSEQQPDGSYVDKVIKPIDWTLAALQHVYRTYLTLPEAHMKLVKSLAHYDDTTGDSAAYSSFGSYYVNYYKGSESAADWSKGSMKGINQLDSTIAHELGHIVDGHHKDGTYGYSKSKDFRKCSGWVEIDNSADTVVKYMIESLNGKPYDGKLSDSELDVAIEISKYLVNNQKSFGDSWSNATSYIKTKFKTVSSIDAARKEELQAMFCDRSIATNLVYHVWMGLGSHQTAAYLSCYNFDKAMNGMKRPFYQGYSYDPWFTFDKSNWSNKISEYQYRCPIEEFAETYASYHCAPTAGTHVVDGKEVPYKKGDKTPPALREWFKKQPELLTQDPSTVKGNADVIKEDDKKKN